MFTGEKPEVVDCVLPGVSLRTQDIKPAERVTLSNLPKNRIPAGHEQQIVLFD
jgi:hypothetical protein